MRAPALALSLVCAAATGCDADCGNPARLDGTYSTLSNTVAADWTVTGYEEDQYEERTSLLYGIFANGTSTWNIRNQPSAGGGSGVQRTRRTSPRWRGLSASMRSMSVGTASVDNDDR